MTQKFWHPTAFSSWGNEEHAAITRVIASGRFTMGPEVEAFEAEFAAYHGRAHSIMVNSGSSANLIATAALFHVKQDRPLRRGDKAVVPAIAWSTTYAPLVQHGIELILMDVDGSWNADPTTREFDPQNAKLIVGCSILGSPAYLAALGNAASALGAFFIEDNCESLGASIGGHKCGTFGDLSTSSLFWSHQVGAIEGGVILTDDDELAGLCRMLRAHGWTRDVEPPETFEAEYDFRLMGYNVRGLELHAAIAREQLKKLDAAVEARRSNLLAFQLATAGLPIVHQETAGVPSPFGLAFEVRGGGPSGRERLVAALRLAGIDCRLPTGGSLRSHVYGDPWASQETPRADLVHRSGLFLGNPPVPAADAMGRIAEVMKAVF